MAKDSLTRKRRTREHIIEDLSINFVTRIIIDCGFTANRIVSDYGYDSEVEPGFLLIQQDRRSDLGDISQAFKITWSRQINSVDRSIVPILPCFNTIRNQLLITQKQSTKPFDSSIK